VGIKAINVDSAFELRRIMEVSAARRQRASVALRVVPGIAGGATPGIQTGGESSKFGMTAPELREALDLLSSATSLVDVAGMHLHIGSQVAETDAFLTGVKFAAEQRQAIGAKLGKPLMQVNLGGGYPTEYAHRRATDRRSSNELDHFAAPRKAAEMVGEVAAAARRWIGEDIEILFEPGRAIVADTALLLTRIESMRQRGDTPWLYLDAGYNLLLDSAAIRWYYHMAVANRMDAPADTGFRLVGPLCDSADCFFDVEGEYLLKSLLQRLPDLSDEQKAILRSEVVRLPSTRPLPTETAPGDVVAIFDVGAYSLEEMFQYCGRLRAGAVMITGDGQVHPIRLRDTFDDLVQHEKP
jgi:diaminopimelate decarboxylase